MTRDIDLGCEVCGGRHPGQECPELASAAGTSPETPRDADFMAELEDLLGTLRDEARAAGGLCTHRDFDNCPHAETTQRCVAHVVEHVRKLHIIASAAIEEVADARAALGLEKGASLLAALRSAEQLRAQRVPSSPEFPVSGVPETVTDEDIARACETIWDGQLARIGVAVSIPVVRAVLQDFVSRRAPTGLRPSSEGTR